MKGHPLLPRRKGGGQIANMNAVKNPWEVYWRRRALRPEDRWVLQLVHDYVPSLIDGRGGRDAVSPAAERMAEVAAVARACWALAMVSRDLAAVGRFLNVEAKALAALGLKRQPKPVLTLAEVLAARAQDAPGSAQGEADGSQAAPSIPRPGGSTREGTHDA